MCRSGHEHAPHPHSHSHSHTATLACVVLRRSPWGWGWVFFSVCSCPRLSIAKGFFITKRCCDPTAEPSSGTGRPLPGRIGRAIAPGPSGLPSSHPPFHSKPVPLTIWLNVTPQGLIHGVRFRWQVSTSPSWPQGSGPPTCQLQITIRPSTLGGGYPPPETAFFLLLALCAKVLTSSANR